MSMWAHTVQRHDRVCLAERPRFECRLGEILFINTFHLTTVPVDSLPVSNSWLCARLLPLETTTATVLIRVGLTGTNQLTPQLQCVGLLRYRRRRRSENYQWKLERLLCNLVSSTGQLGRQPGTIPLVNRNLYRVGVFREPSRIYRHIPSINTDPSS